MDELNGGAGVSLCSDDGVGGFRSTKKLIAVVKAMRETSARFSAGGAALCRLTADALQPAAVIRTAELEKTRLTWWSSRRGMRSHRREEYVSEYMGTRALTATSGVGFDL